MTRFALASLVLSVLACGSQTPAPAPMPIDPTPTPAPEPAATADDAGDDIVIGKRFVLDSKVMGEARPYWVHTPRGYESGERRYPLIVLLDGDGHLHHVSGITTFLARHDRMPPAIIVGLPNTDRTRDLTPTNQARLPTSGGADTFLRFIETELIPRIEADYRTVRYRILIGHSFGGLFAVNALIKRPGLFDAYIAASPSLQWDNRLMERLITPLLGSADLGRPFLYFSLGTEGPGITEGNEKFAALLEKSGKGMRWKFDLMKAEDHGSVVHRTVYRGLEMLFDRWHIPVDEIRSVDDLEVAYKKRKVRYVVDSKIPEGLINVLGYRHMQKTPPDIATARSFFELNIKLYPNSANVYDSLGESYERAGDLDKALELYERAVSLAKPGEPFAAAFVQNRDRVKAKVKAK